jgi:hypothetical protein
VVKALLIIIALAFAGGSALSRPLQVAGTAGYLSEWELRGTAEERTSSGGTEYFGQLIWKHVGLCSVSGPQEKPGQIRFRISRAGSSSRIAAMISLGGVECIYNGDVSGSGHMDCPDAKGVPLSISIK